MASDLSSMNESQPREALKCVIAELKTIKSISGENSQLRSELNLYKLKEENSKSVVNENCEQKKERQMRQDVLKLWKEDKEYFFEREKQLNQITKERDFLSKQLKYKHECGLLRKKNRDLEVALSTQEKELRVKTHVLELEVEKTQKKAGKLQEKNDKLQEEKNKFQEEKNKLQKQMSQLQLALTELQFENHTVNNELSETCRRENDRKRNACTLEKRCHDLEKQLERTIKKLEVKCPVDWFNDCQEPPRHERKPGVLHLELKGRLTAKCRQLEKKDHMLKEKEKQIEELKQDMSRLMPPEMLELIPKRQWVIREQSNKIKVLTAQVKMYQSKHDEYKSERETLADRAVAMKKLYLKEKMYNTELWAVLATKSGGISLPHSSQKQSRENQLNTKRPTIESIAPCLPPISNKSQPKPAVKLGHIRSAPPKVLIPHSSHVLPKQSRENQLDSKRPTIKPIVPGLVPISNKSQPKPDVKLGHTWSSTAPHPVLPKSDEKSDTTVTQKIYDKSRGKSKYTVLPPISKKSSQVQSRAGQNKIFMTEPETTLTSLK